MIYPDQVDLVQHVFSSCPETVQYLFPNCQLVACFMDFSEGFTFFTKLISPSVRRLCLFFGELTLTSIDFLYDVLAMRLPNLHTLELGIDKEPTQLAECQETFLRIISLFYNTLQRVKVPTWFSNKKTLLSLYRMPSLVAMLFDSYGEFFTDSRPPFFPRYNNDESNFNALQAILFGGSGQTFHSVLFGQFKFSALTVFRWTIDETSIAFDLLPYALTLSAACPQLVRLELINAAPSQSYEDIHNLPLANWSSLKVLLACERLTIMLLPAIKFPLDMPQLTEVLSSRRTWNKIAIYTEDPMSFDVLPLFAKHCPDMTSLSINVNASTAAGPLPDLEPGLSFSDLVWINFNYNLEDESNGRLTDIAHFLFRICESPLYIHGWTNRLWNWVCLHMASLYVRENKNTSTGLSAELRTYLRRQRIIRREFFERDWEPELDVGCCRLMNGEYLD